MIEIQPTQVPLEAKYIEIGYNYQFNATDATMQVLYKDNDGNIIKATSVYIPTEIYMSWQADSVIIDYVLQQLNLTLA